jgi:hypothetical protein
MIRYCLVQIDDVTQEMLNDCLETENCLIVFEDGNTPLSFVGNKPRSLFGQEEVTYSYINQTYFEN